MEKNKWYSNFKLFDAMIFGAVINFQKYFQFPGYIVWIIGGFQVWLSYIYEKNNGPMKAMMFRVVQVLGIVLFVVSIILLFVDVYQFWH